MTPEELDAMRSLMDGVPTDLVADWDGSNHYELHSGGVAEYFWFEGLEAADVLKSVPDPSGHPVGRRFGLVLELAAAAPRLFAAIEEMGAELGMFKMGFSPAGSENVKALQAEVERLNQELADAKADVLVMTETAANQGDQAVEARAEVERLKAEVERLKQPVARHLIIPDPPDLTKDKTPLRTLPRGADDA